MSEIFLNIVMLITLFAMSVLSLSGATFMVITIIGIIKDEVKR